MANLTSIIGSNLISNAPSVMTGNWQNLNIQANNTSIISSSTLTGRIIISSVAGSILSLTTAATDQVTVFSKGTVTGSGSSGSIALIYNGITKDASTVKQAAAADETTFSLMYYDAPGAATANVVTSVIATGALTIANNEIIIQKIT